MKKILLLFSYCISSLALFAQPVNDDCSGLIDLGVAPICPSSGIYTNVDATASDIGNDNIPICFNGGNVDRDVWFQFTTDATITDYNITVTGVSDGMGSDPITNPQIEVYRGDLCGFDELAALVVCASANNGDNFVTTTVLDLDPNTVYYIRVNDYTASATPNSGSFEFCITEFIPDVNICDGPGSTACSGTLFDCGGPDMDYGTNENFVYTVCPNEFHECILIDIIDFNIENNFDFLNIYAGEDINAPLLATLTGTSSGNDFQIQVSTNCVTFQFTSDGSANQPGFELDWLCVSFPCDGSNEDNPEVIGSLPFIDTESSCGEGSSIGDSPCPDDDFLNGPDYFYIYDSPGGLCAAIEISNAEPGTGVLVLDGPPSDPATNCVAQGQGGVIASANFETPGIYYIIVANGSGCTDFDINITEADCNLSPALVDALCNPLNGCQEFDPDGMSVPSVFNLDIGFEDVPITQGLNNGCYLGTGAGNFYWFTIQSQADGPFGFIVDGENFASDIDLSVWGPFTEEEVCDTPADVIDFITNNQPIRSSWSGGAGPTGLVDIHPIDGTPVTDPFDCGSPDTPGAGGDDFVSTIPTLQDEVYVILINDWGGQITDGVVQVDWSPSNSDVLEAAPIEVMGSDTTICIGESAMLEVNAGINNIQWLGDVSSLSCTDCPNPIASPTVTTIYQVAVNGVCISDTIDVKVSVFDVQAGPDFTVCLGEDVQFMAGTEFDNATYEWTGPNLGDLSCTDCPDPVLTTSSPGTFTYNVTLDGPNCLLMDEVTVTVLADPAPMFEVVADTVLLCIGESTDLGLATNPIIYSYTWTSEPAGFSSTDPNPNITPTESATYYVSVSSTLCPVTSFDSVYVDVAQLPIVDLTADTTVCQGQSVTLGNTTPEAGVNYQWTPDTGLDFDDVANPVATIQSTETYTLTATRGGCETIESVTVTSTVISVTINNPDSLLICRGEEVNLSAVATPPGTTISWSPDNGSITPTTGTNVVASPEIFTTYFATVEVPGCIVMDSVFIDVDSIPSDMSIIPSDTTVCMGAIVILQSPIYEQSDFPDIQHQWQPTGGLQSPDTLYNVVLQADETTTFFRTTTNGICTQVDSALVTVEPTAIITVVPSDTVVCIGESVQFMASSDGIDDFEWTPDDGSLSCTDCPDPIATLPDPGTYTFEVSGEFLGCPSSTNASITVIASPVSNIADDTNICIGESVTLNFSTDPLATYVWTADPADSSLDPNDPEPVVTPSVTTTYNVTIDNGVCDPVQEQVIVQVSNPNPIITVSPDVTICGGEIVNLEAMSSDDAGTFSWSTGEEGTSISDMPEFTTTYTVTYTYPCGEPIVNTITVTVLEGLDIDIEPSSADTSFAEGATIDLSAITFPESPGASYEWSTGQMGQIISTQIIEQESATYIVTVTTTDGCEFIDSVTYNIIPAMFDFPNAFSPNGDNVSDYFNLVFDGNIEVTEFKIFSRWGEIVYNNENPTQGWDGRKDDKDMPSDVYLYFAVVKRPSGEEFVLKGDVTLIR